MTTLAGVERWRIALPQRGVEIAVLDWGGDGAPALLHHANGFCAALWAPVAEALRPALRPLAVDARGHGDSSRPEGPDAYRWSELADDLAAVGARLLAELGAPRFALGLGHSFGGTLTLAAAARQRGLYERILLVDPVIRPPLRPGQEPNPRGGELAARARRRRAHFESRDAARAYFAARPLFARWTPRALDLYVEEGLRGCARGGVELKCAGSVEGAIFAGNQGMDLFEEARRVEIPARLLWARHGDFPRAGYERIASGMARGEVVDLEARHLVVMEEPELVVDAVRAFCQAGPVEEP